MRPPRTWRLSDLARRIYSRPMIKKACGFLCLTAAILSQAFGADDDTPADHHHTSHLFAVYPGCQISPGLTPALAGAAKVSLDARGIDPGSDVREWSFACAGGELKRAAIRSLKGRPCQVRCGDTVVDLKTPAGQTRHLNAQLQ